MAHDNAVFHASPSSQLHIYAPYAMPHQNKAAALPPPMVYHTIVPVVYGSSGNGTSQQICEDQHVLQGCAQVARIYLVPNSLDIGAAFGLGFRLSASVSSKFRFGAFSSTALT